MTEIPVKLSHFSDAEFRSMLSAAPRIRIVDGALAPELIAKLTGLFPNVTFDSLGADWAEASRLEMDIVVVGLDASARRDVEKAFVDLKRLPGAKVIIVLRNAGISDAKGLIEAGASDVLVTPISEIALALSLERLLARGGSGHSNERPSGKIVALLKSGGGVGATAIGVQIACMLAKKPGLSEKVCFADLDLQFGVGSLYFDLAEALTVTDCLAVGELLSETQFSTALTKHSSGVRVLGGVRELTALEALTPQRADELVRGLRRDFAVTIVDLPSVWTAWTNRVLHLADQIILVTGLSVPHVHLVRRQLNVLHQQKLDGVPLAVICNAVTADQQDMLSVKSAEKSIGRSFDVVVPEDKRVMEAAVNQGVEISTIRKGTKLEKAIGVIADALAARVTPNQNMRTAR